MIKGGGNIYLKDGMIGTWFSASGRTSAHYVAIFFQNLDKSGV